MPSLTNQSGTASRAAVFHVGQVQIASRRGTDLTEVFPELVAAVADQVPDGTLLDSELVVMRDGRLSFDALQHRMASRARQAAKLASASPDTGDLVVLGRTTALTAAQAATVGQVLSPPVGSHPWPDTMGAGHFGGEPVAITHADPVITAEVSADTAEQAGRRRPLRFLRIRYDS